MAAANPAETLLGSLTCLVCQNYFKDPVSLNCGHHFCQACITRYWEGLHTNFHCPECRQTFSQRKFKPNRHLRNIVEASRPLPLKSTKEPKVERVCEKHKRVLELFCQEDQIPICVVCHLSRDHKEHTVVPIEEATEDYKTQIQSRLEILRKQREEILSFKLNGENQTQELLKQLETERQKTVSEFQRLCQFLEEQKQLLLAQLEELNKEIEKRWDEYVTKLSEEISCFSYLITETEQKCQLPASEFLQDIKRTLSRCKREKFQNPATFPAELKWRLWESSLRNASLETTVKKFKVVSMRSPSELEILETLSSRQQWEKANVTLDPDTAHPWFVLSVDRRNVRWGRWQALPKTPERFDTAPCVLGCVGFTEGRHYWEVEIEDELYWSLGVARESVKRKGEISFNPEHGIWAVERTGDWWRAFTSPKRSILFSLSRAPRRIRVYLDYEGGQVAFFDGSNGDLIFTFAPASFAGERLHPFFGFGLGRHPALRLSPLGLLDMLYSQFDSRGRDAQLTLCP